MPKKKASIGDILEIKTPSGLAYLQYTHAHDSMGCLVRILPGLFESRPKDFANLARQKELYFTFYSLKYAVPEGEAEIVSHQPIPDWAKPYPMIRHPVGFSNRWVIMRADMPLTIENLVKATKYIGLTLEQRKLSINALWSHPFLVERLAQGWTPERSEEFDLRARAEEEAKEQPQPKAAPAESVRHYLYFPQKPDAEEAARWFRSQGFSVDVRLGAGKENWLALVKHEAVENVDEMEKLREEMEALAERLNGEYDGWEVAV